jgi:hypothetical protein
MALAQASVRPTGPRNVVMVGGRAGLELRFGSGRSGASEKLSLNSATEQSLNLGETTWPT